MPPKHSGSGSGSGTGSPNGTCAGDTVIMTFQAAAGFPVTFFAPSDGTGFGCPTGGPAVLVIACLTSKGFRIVASTQDGTNITYTLVRC
jgi:hypothetical protein